MEETPSWLLSLGIIDQLISVIKIDFESIARSSRIEIRRGDLDVSIAALNKVLNVLRRLEEDNSMSTEIKEAVTTKAKTCTKIIIRIIGKIDGLTVRQSTMDLRKKLISIISDCDKILEEIKV